MDLIEVCRKFIELDTTPDNGTVELVHYAADLCRRAGLYVEIQSETHNGVDQANLIVRPMSLRPSAELLLQTHLDTGDPGSYALWTRTGANPFNASIYRDAVTGVETLYGLGASSNKLDFVCKLKAVTEMKGSTWRLPWVLVGTFGEELGMPGVIKLIRKKMISANQALVGEATDLRPIYAGKGFAGVEIEIPFSEQELEFRAKHDQGDGATTQSRVFVGKAAHSSMPQLGESAIAKMLDYLAKLPDGLAIMEIEGGISFNTVPAHAVLEIDMVGGLSDTIGGKIARISAAIAEVEKRFQAFPDLEFSPPEPTLNLGMIRTFADHIKMRGCCRLPPTVSHEVYEEWMEIIRAACHDVGAVFRITDYKRPFRTSPQSSLLQVCKEELDKMDLPSKFGAQSVANEANVLSRFGVECVVIGPGIGVGNSHAPNENVRVSQLHEAVRFYKAVLERVCL